MNAFAPNPMGTGRRFRNVLLGAVLALATAPVTRAADTEIYFSGSSLQGVARSNVLLILDTSGSMIGRTIGSSQSRIDALKQATTQLLQDVENANLGLIGFKTTDGGAVLFPITYLKENVGNIVSEDLTTEVEYDAVIGSADDDVEQSASRGVQRNDNAIGTRTPATTAALQNYTWQEQVLTPERDGSEVISTGFIRNIEGVIFLSSRRMALLFDAPIPTNADITNAEITVTNRQASGSTPFMWEASVEGSDWAAPLAACASCAGITSRTFIGQSLWTINPPIVQDVSYFHDITAAVQELVERGCVTAGDPRQLDGCTYEGRLLLSLITNNTLGRIRTFGFDAAMPHPDRPSLSVEYRAPATFEPITAGLRFENIRIPQGSSVSEATLVLTASNNYAGPTSPPRRLTVTVEDADDSAEFTAADGPRNRTVSSVSASFDLVPGDPNDPQEGEWVEDNPLSIPVTALLNGLVQRPNWCGGNAAAFIVDIDNAGGIAVGPEFQSFENPGGSPARLNYKYTPPAPGTPPPAGCFASRENAQAAFGGDDAEQEGLTVFISRPNLTLGQRGGQSQTIGLRFEGVDVPSTSTITRASLEFFAQGASTGPARFIIEGLTEDAPPVFVAAADNIGQRPRTGASVVWISGDWDTPDERYATADIKDIVQELVNRPGWTSGGTMGFAIESASFGTRTAHSVDGNPGRAPRLTIEYKGSQFETFKTVRERLIEEVDLLPASGSTPIQEVMLEAMRYWRGEDMEYGNKRVSQYDRISHPATYCTAVGACGNVLSTTEIFEHPILRIDISPSDDFGVYLPDPICETNLYDFRCRREIIGVRNPDRGGDPNRYVGPQYISPIRADLECGRNHQVLLSDGIANSGGEEALISSEIGRACYADNSGFRPSGDLDLSYDLHTRCIADMVEFLATTDQSAAVDGEQTVQTSTIAFSLADPAAIQLLRDAANLGQGDFYTADTADELAEVFEEILVEVRSDSVSFVSPSLATNAFNRLLSRDEIYFGLFTPNRTRAWFGNVKKYNICVDSSRGCSLGEILDADRNGAIDADDSRFRQTARSIWSAAPDGRETTQGGSGAEITDYTQQTLYTDMNNNGLAASGTSLLSPGFVMRSMTWNRLFLNTMRSAICPVPSTAPGSDCEDRMLWLLGRKVVTDSENDVNADQRWSVNDVLHSSPVVITYGGSGSTFYDKLIYGTNDGSLHFVNALSGQEEWRFLPSDFWAQQQQLYLNPEGEHSYGMDITPTLWVIDNNRDGVIEPAAPENDSVRVFLATRRSGSYMYALDLSASVDSPTDPVVPRFLWRIAGGGTDFPRLRQTWSQPQITSISTANGSRDVLIFGGGWDEALDSSQTFTIADNGGNEFRGNAIYIVDPTDGSKLMDISGSAGSDIVVPEMDYSIPSRLRLVDSDGNGDTDRIYVGDSGGQIFRVDLDPNMDLTSSSPEGDTLIGRLANISASTPVSERRRFFEPPSVVQVRDETYSDTPEYDYVLIGSGYRAHPLDLGVQDRFYAFRDYAIGGLSDSDGDNLVERVDNYTPSGDPLSNADLVDVTNAELDSSDTAQRNAAGWYFDFTSAGFVGEKVLSAPTTTAGVVTFTTFRPDPDAAMDPCRSGVGNASAYNFNILSAAAALDWDADDNLNLDDRKLDLGSGIPSSVVPIFTREGVVGIVGIEGGAAQLGVLSGLPRYRTYWYEEL